jgi:hypothetical protein
MLDRDALDRVLARAAELQAHTAGGGEGALSEAQVVDIGKEVGISTQHLRQALAEERGRLTLPPDEGLAGRIAGPGFATASRTVTGNPEQVMASLVEWMEREECLQIKRRFPDRITWEPRRDFIGNIKRGLNIGGRGYMLTRASEVGATALAVDESRTLVMLDADLSQTRRGRITGGAVTAAGGVLAGAAPLGIGAVILPDPSFAFFLLGGAIAAAGSLAGALGGLGIARTHRGVVERAQLALEQILDRMERPDVARPRLPGMFDAAERLINNTMADLQGRSKTWPRSRK